MHDKVEIEIVQQHEALENSSVTTDPEKADSNVRNPVASTASGPSSKTTIGRDSLKTPLKIHGLAVVLIPLVGSIVALAMAFRFGIGLLELGLFVCTFVLTGIGITVGFHRHFAHGAFQTNKIVRATLAILGSMACQGPLIYWVATHRRHHKHSDLADDPHSPHMRGEARLGVLQGLWHAHLGWTLDHEITNTTVFAKDLLKDRALLKISQRYFLWAALGIVIPAILGGLLTWSFYGALIGFLWGGMVRLFISHCVTHSVNSITHMYGSRPFANRDRSTNNVWLAIPTLGEAWHNNHHAFPDSAMFGLKWTQIDLGGWVIRALEFVGLAWDVKAPNAERIAKKSQSAEMEVIADKSSATTTITNSD